MFSRHPNASAADIERCDATARHIYLLRMKWVLVARRWMRLIRTRAQCGLCRFLLWLSAAQNPGSPLHHAGKARRFERRFLYE
jgi:hypothetical protein